MSNDGHVRVACPEQNYGLINVVRGAQIREREADAGAERLEVTRTSDSSRMACAWHDKKRRHNATILHTHRRERDTQPTIDRGNGASVV